MSDDVEDNFVSFPSEMDDLIPAEIPKFMNDMVED